MNVVWRSATVAVVGSAMELQLWCSMISVVSCRYVWWSSECSVLSCTGSIVYSSLA